MHGEHEERARGREREERESAGRERDGDLPAARINMLYAPEAGGYGCVFSAPSSMLSFNETRREDWRQEAQSASPGTGPRADGEINSGGPQDRDFRCGRW